MEELNLGTEELIKRFEEDLKTAGKAKNTIQTYPQTIRAFSRFVDGNLLGATKENLQAYLNSMRDRDFRQTTIGRYFIILSKFYEFLIYTELYTQANPIITFRKRYLRPFKGSSGSSQRWCPTTEEVTKLVNSILNTRDKAIVVLLFKTGIRRKELSELDFSDLDINKMTIKLKKTAKRTNRLVYFDEETAYVLGRWLKRREILNKGKNPALFLSKYGDRLDLYPIDDLFRKYAKMTGLYKGAEIEDKVTPHCARHWFTTELLEAGMSFEHVEHLRGDKGKSAASRYHHPNENKLKGEYQRSIPQFGLI
ncbi:MAG: tyrosine-type recombinase/integrase [Methanotrichaceae archaeon]|jgi:integrase/recombinase XerD